MRLLAWSFAALSLLACGKLRATATDDAGPAAADSAPTVASAAPSTSASAVTPAAKAPPKPGSHSPTSDRFKRNVPREGDCPAGFLDEDPHDGDVTCARQCKTDKDCHNKMTCQDAHTNEGKVCDVAPAGAAPGGGTDDGCKPGETSFAGTCVRTCKVTGDCKSGEVCRVMGIAVPGMGVQETSACQPPMAGPKPSASGAKPATSAH